MNCKLGGDKFGKTVHFKKHDNFVLSDKAYSRLDGKWAGLFCRVF
jgi:hypothetical protein